MRPHFPSVVQWTAAGTGIGDLPRDTGDIGHDIIIIIIMSAHGFAVVFNQLEDEATVHQRQAAVDEKRKTHVEILHKYVFLQHIHRPHTVCTVIVENHAHFPEQAVKLNSKINLISQRSTH